MMIPSTGKCTETVNHVDGIPVQYNSAIGMFRVHPEERVPPHLKGYTPHYKALEMRVSKWVQF